MVDGLSGAPGISDGPCLTGTGTGAGGAISELQTSDFFFANLRGTFFAHNLRHASHALKAL